MAFEPPPTHATSISGRRPFGLQHLLARFLADHDWKSRTIAGIGCGPATVPMM
jgi:hypothetical protein